MSANPIRWIRQVFTPKWPTVEATVDSCSWVRDSDYTGVEAGHYDVAVSYRPASPIDPDELRHGHFRGSGSRQIAPYRIGEQIPIRYSPKNPHRLRIADSSPNYEKLETILVMALFALLAGYLLFTF